MSTRESASYKANVGGVVFKKTAHPKFKEDGQGWKETDVSDTLNIFDNSEMRTPILIVQGDHGDGDMESPGESSAGQ